MRTTDPFDERSSDSTASAAESDIPKLSGAATRQPKPTPRRARDDWDAQKRVPAAKQPSRPVRGKRRGANTLARAVVVERPARLSVRPGSFGASLSLHVAVLLAFLLNPSSPLSLTEPQPQPEPVPVEIAFVPVPTAPQRAVAPPAPKRAPKPVTAPAAPQRPAEPERAAAPTTARRAQPKVANLERPHRAETPRQRAVEPPKHAEPDLQALLNARQSGGKAQDATSLARLSERARAGAEGAPDRQSATGAPQGAATTSRSGLDGALASRAPLRTVTPVYPEAAMRLGDEGAVRLRIYVAPSGAVSHVEVVASSGRSYFDRAAMAAMSQWRFNALEGGGGEQYGDITLTFSLR